MLSCLVPPRFGQEDSIMPSSAKFALQFPALASGLPKDDESSSGTPQTDCFLQCPQCHQTVQGFQALKDHIAAVHPAIKQEHGSATPSPPLSAFYHHSQQQQSQFQPIGASLPSPPASASALESNDPPSLNGATTEPNGRSSSSNSNRSNSSSSSSRSTSAGGTLADEGGRSISPTYSNSSHGAEPYACLQCSASFPNRDLLEKHELLHVPNALVSCKVCHKQFANVYRLQRHMISHDESTLLRKFKCTDCDKAFKFKHHLKEHVRIHSGEKPFACTNCGKRFSHSGSYSSHMTSKKCISLGLKVPTNSNNNNNNSSAVSNNNNHSPKSGEKSSRRSGSGYLPGGSPAAAGLSNGGLPSGQQSPNTFLPMLPKYPPNYEAMNAAFLASFHNPFYPMAALNPGNPAFNPYSIQRLLELSAAGAGAAPGAESMESLLLKTQQQLQASGDRKSPQSDAEDMIEEIVDNEEDEEEEEEPKLVMDVDDPEEDEEDDRKDIKVDDDEDDDDEEEARSGHEDRRSTQNSPVGSEKTSDDYRNILDDMKQKILDVAHRMSAGGSPLVEDIKTERPESTSPELNIDTDRRSPSPQRVASPEQRPVEIKRELKEDEDMKESEQPKQEAPLLQCQQCKATFNHQTELVQHEQVLCQSLMYHHQAASAAAANYLPMIQSGSEDDCDFDGQKSNPSERSGKVRVRTAISEEQQNELKKYYALNNKPNREEFQLIAKRVGMEARVVQVWFQNNRSRERKMGGSTGVPPPSPAPTAAAPPSQSEAEQPLDLSIRKSDSSPSSSPRYGTAPQSQSESAATAAALLDEAMNLSLKSQSRSSTPYKGFYPYPPALVRQTPSPNEQLRAPPLPAGYPTGLAPTAPVSFVGMDRLLQQFSPEMARSAPIRADSLSPGSEKLSGPWSAAYDEQKLQLQMQSMLTVPKRVLYPTGNVSAAGNPAGLAGLGKEQPDAEGQYVCDQCDKAFSKHSSLQRHKYEHSGQRPYKCLECPKAFKHKHHLTEHKRLHSGEKPFQCCKCLKRFSHSGSYSQHMNHRYSYCKPYRDGK
uniref:Putative homeobox transcription factor sip1 n=1 Tax=Culex tarsalis TaxID=7177 RepID=A0A1Q3EY93_CULTA